MAAGLSEEGERPPRERQQWRGRALYDMLQLWNSNWRQVDTVIHVDTMCRMCHGQFEHLEIPVRTTWVMGE